MTPYFLSRAELAERIGVKPDSLARYKLPAPDAMIGTTRGWLPSTVDRWNESRPGSPVANAPGKSARAGD